MSVKRLRPNPDISWRVIDAEIVILVIKTLTYYSLNEVGTYAWSKLVEKPHTREELLAAILAEFDVDRATATADLDELLADLMKEDLVREET